MSVEPIAMTSILWDRNRFNVEVIKRVLGAVEATKDCLSISLASDKFNSGGGIWLQNTIIGTPGNLGTRGWQ